MSEFPGPEQVRAAKHSILNSGALCLGEFGISNGKIANNILAMEAVFTDIHKLKRIIRPLGKLTVAQFNDVDLIVGIPNGGDMFATEIATQNIFHKADLVKINKGPQHYGYASKRDRELILDANKILLTQDVTNRRSSEYLLYQSLPELEEKVSGCLTVWYRGEKDEIIDLKPPLSALIIEPIPNRIDERHPLFKFATRR